MERSRQRCRLVHSETDKAGATFCWPKLALWYLLLVSAARCWRDERNADHKEEENGRAERTSNVVCVWFFIPLDSERGERWDKWLVRAAIKTTAGNQIVASGRKGRCARSWQWRYYVYFVVVVALSFGFKKVNPWLSISPDRASHRFLFLCRRCRRMGWRIAWPSSERLQRFSVPSALFTFTFSRNPTILEYRCFIFFLFRKRSGAIHLTGAG